MKKLMFTEKEVMELVKMAVADTQRAVQSIGPSSRRKLGYVQLVQWVVPAMEKNLAELHLFTKNQ